MGLKDKLTQQGSPLSKNNGGQNAIPVGATDQSKLHFEYSINGNPNQISKPQPSALDLDGQKPLYSYDQNAPTEGLGNI
tara:strand:- start:4975 stop:5211 length:237 start_codon:yes stop_codon:yes gene_type:complete